jgi:hypothetical protein
MKSIILAAAVLALLTPVAHAQSTPGADASMMEAPGRYLVFFPVDRAELDAADRRIVAQAAEEFRTTGRAEIEVSGHTDTLGPADYNRQLSERRAQMVADELQRQGVPAGDIVVIGRGEDDLRIPTGDDVAEAGNRRVEIVFDVAAPEPAPVAAAPETTTAVAPPPPPAVTAEPEADRRFIETGGFSIGGLYGYGFDDQDHRGGLNLSYDFGINPGLSVELEQGVFWTFGDGVGGRSVAGLNFNFGRGEGFIPYVGGNIGGHYGNGIDNSWLAGPEIGLKLGVLDAKVAYDMPFNKSWDDGFIVTTIGLGIRF